MNNVLLVYGDIGEEEFTEIPTSFDDLKLRLENIRDKYNALLKMSYSVDLVREGVGHLSVGLGYEQWMLFYYSEDGEMVLNSLGDEDVEGTVLFYFGDRTELSKKYLVPEENALEVIRVWFEQGELSDAIKWTEKIY